MIVELQLLLLLVLLCCSAFFSGTETAITAASRARIYALSAQGDHRAARVERLHSQMERVIATILLGNTFVNNFAAALTAVIFATYFGTSGGMVVVASICITAAIFIFSEVLPKTYAVNNPERVSMAMAPVLSAIVAITYPLTHVTQIIISGVLRLAGVRVEREPGAEESIEELRGAIDLHSESAEEIREAGAMLHSILDLDEVPVSDIMVHRRNMTMIDADLPPEQIVRQVLDSPHTRIPIWRKEPDNIIGVLHAKGLLRALHNSGWRLQGIDVVALSGKPWFIPEGTTLLSQLEAFKTRREHFAIVVDEYGALMGVVTLEDILEEIVGDIADEHDKKVEGVVPEEEGSYIVDGSVTLRDLNRELDWDLPDEHASTLAGLILYEARQIPLQGQVFTFYNLRFEILERQRNQIRKIRVTPLEPKEPHADKDAPAQRHAGGQA
ncbi:HlyC/CorC family transporter [Dongia deserti]|uniref:HlyC/CorC family transporter n=1 Tax=Dongia deserti TaxID=2268030 RepID=UPI000E65957B|nr:HlyC/CorC family transporter [Dongia deserti]